MTVESTSEPVPAELASFDALKRRQLMHRDALTFRKMPTNGQVRANWRALRILVVDGQHQEPVNRRVEQVRRLGHTASLAFDRFAALRVAAAQHPDVVLLDSGITLVDSCQIARHLRLNLPGKDVWIIALTRRIDEVRRNKCIDAGINVLLAEPVDPDVFETLLMLECLRVNRSETDEAAALSGEGFVRLRSQDTVS